MRWRSLLVGSLFVLPTGLGSLWRISDPPRVAAAEHGGPTDRVVDWPVYGGDAAGDHYSPLKQIDRTNAKSLAVAWTFDTGEAGQMETSPIVVGRVLYGATATQKIFALDAGTGKQMWRFDSGVHGTQPIRGVTYWEDGGRGRVLAGVMNYLYELDAATGRPIESFGDGGRIDLRNDLDADPEQLTVALTTPGVIFGDIILLGDRLPETRPSARGDIRAYNLRTGKLQWSFHTIPHPGEPGYETWPPDAWKTAGAANNWAGMALDLKRGIVYVPTGSAVDDFYGADRIGKNLYADCLLALDARSGKLLWYFQGVHHDLWDRDFPAPPVLLTLKRDGQSVDAVAQTTKTGYVYVFDRVTGKPLFPIEERAYPQSDVPGEKSWPTQPLPLAPAPYSAQAVTEQDLTNRTPEAHAWALEQLHSFRSGGQFVPPNARTQTIMMPGYDGGAEWGGAAADTRSGVLYLNAINIAYTGGLEEAKPSRGVGAALYLSQCAVCHGTERKGSPPEFPSLVGVRDRLTDEQIAATIHRGKGRMPSYPNVEGARLRALMEYLRTGVDVAGPGESEAALPIHKGARGMPGEDKAGAASFAEHCAICHGDDGGGIQPGFPSLIGVGQRLETKQIGDVIHTGRGRMPPFRSLPDPEVHALLRFLAADSLPAMPRSASGKELETETAPKVEAHYRFTGYRKFLDPDGYPATAPPWGTLNAIDLNTGRYLWKIPFGSYPELEAKGLRETGTESYGGPIVTAGGLILIGATIFDREMHAYDSSTGELLWRYELPAAGLATPATYMVDGRQFVVIAVGGGKNPKRPFGSLYMAFSIPQTKPR